jgi:hypothetical protein
MIRAGSRDRAANVRHFRLAAVTVVAGASLVRVEMDGNDGAAQLSLTRASNELAQVSRYRTAPCGKSDRRIDVMSIWHVSVRQDQERARS